MKPPKLFPGARLGVFAPSSPATLAPAVIERGYQRLKEYGFEVSEAPQCRKVTGHAAGSARERAETIHAFLKDDMIHGLMAFWGGYQSHQILEHLDFDLVRKHPKPILGYSDVTSLSNGIHAMTGLVGFSAPCVISFAKPEVPPYTWDAMRSVLVEGKSDVTYSASRRWSDNKWWEKDEMLWEPTPTWQTFRGGKANGVWMGGNAGTLLLLAGTKFWPKLDGALLFLEEDESEKPATIDRMFTQYRQMGVWSQIRGLAVGRFSRQVRFTESDTFRAILEDSLRGCDFPVLYDVDFGHTDPIMTMPIGIRGEIDADRKTISLSESSVV